MNQEAISSFRIMRLIVLFDLPMQTNSEKREYHHYRKLLLEDGFQMLQFSVYIRFCKNIQDASKHIARVSALTPEKGNIRILNVTEKQFEEMILVIGEKAPSEYVINEQFTMVIE